MKQVPNHIAYCTIILTMNLAMYDPKLIIQYTTQNLEYHIWQFSLIPQTDSMLLQYLNTKHHCSYLKLSICTKILQRGQ